MTPDQRYKQRQREAGYRQVTLWCHVDDEHKLRSYNLRLKKKRLKENNSE